MKTITTTYGHLAEASSYNIGIFKMSEKEFFAQVEFPTKGTCKRTRIINDEDKIKTFIINVIEHTKTNDFPFKDKNGIVQWTDYNPEAPTL
tara:strand:+ start:284 stop:556 length:273 start_codon:yes stop_codon:yes gene_type:complete